MPTFAQQTYSASVTNAVSSFTITLNGVKANSLLVLGIGSPSNLTGMTVTDSTGQTWTAGNNTFNNPSSAGAFFLGGGAGSPSGVTTLAGDHVLTVDIPSTTYAANLVEFDAYYFISSSGMDTFSGPGTGSPMAPINGNGRSYINDTVFYAFGVAPGAVVDALEGAWTALEMDPTATAYASAYLIASGDSGLQWPISASVAWSVDYEQFQYVMEVASDWYVGYVALG